VTHVADSHLVAISFQVALDERPRIGGAQEGLEDPRRRAAQGGPALG
jgi:hypothetical protein